MGIKKKAAVAAICCVLTSAMTILLGTVPAWADASAVKTVSLATDGLWNETLQGAQGSQLGLYYIASIGNVKTRVPNHPFMDLKFSSSSLTVYWIGPSSALQLVNPMDGDQASSQEVDLALTSCTYNGSSDIPGQWVYNPSPSDYDKDKGKVQSETIPFSSGSQITLQYPSYSVLHSYVDSSPSFKYNSDTFNSDITQNVVDIDTGQVTHSETTFNTNYFTVKNNGDIQEIGGQDESIEFKNGATISFNPYADSFSIQNGSSSSSDTVKVTSSDNGEVIENLSLNEDSSDNSFNSGSDVTISASSSNPITSAKYTFTGDSVSASSLASQGWNLAGSTTVANRYNSVQLHWQPTASNLPVYRYMLFKYLGLADFNTLRSAYPSFFNWLIDDPNALNEFLTSGYASDVTIEGMTPYLWGLSDNYELQESPNPASELSSLEIWAKIWRKYPNSRGGTDLKIAVAVCLDFAHNVMTWETGKPIDPVGRYEIYAAAFGNHTLLGNFSQYSAQMMRDVVDDELSNAELEWFRNYIIDYYPIYTSPKFVHQGHTLIHYLDYSPYGWVQMPDFYGPTGINAVWSILRYGGVCGSNSKLSVFLLQAFGMAGWPDGQPGHCAFVFFYQNKWNLGYEITGWPATGWPEVLALMFNGTQLNANQFSKDKSYSLTFEAEANMARGNYGEALKEVEEAESLAPNNIDCWRVYIEVCKRLGVTSGLEKKIEDTFASLYSTAPYVQVLFSKGGLTDQYDSIISSLQKEIS